MNEANQAESRIPETRIYVELGELSPKQKKTVVGLLGEMGFLPEEIKEIVIQMPESEKGEGK